MLATSQIPTEPELARYVHGLIGRFASHGPAADPAACACGGLLPCAEEQRVALMLELAGDACR